MLPVGASHTLQECKDARTNTGPASERGLGTGWLGAARGAVHGAAGVGAVGGAEGGAEGGLGGADVGGAHTHVTGAGDGGDGQGGRLVLQPWHAAAGGGWGPQVRGARREVQHVKQRLRFVRSGRGRVAGN
jgi:hypothetical protein